MGLLPIASTPTVMEFIHYRFAFERVMLRIHA